MTASRRLFAALVVLSIACRSTGKTRLAQGGTEVARVASEAATRATAGSARAAMRGDWVLRDRDLRVTVTGSEAPARNEPPGTIAHVAVLSSLGHEAVRTVEPIVRARGVEVALTDVRFEATPVAGAPVLRVSARASVNGQPLEVIREYALETGRFALHVRTRVTNLGAAAVEGVSLGARLEWGATPFAPGIGALNRACEGRTRWVGSSAHGVTAAWTRLSGTRDLALRFTEDMHGTTVVSSHTEAFSDTITLAPGRAVEERAMLIVSPGDLTDVARAVAFAREDPVAEARVIVHGDLHESEVLIVDGKNEPVLLARPHERTFTLPLAPGDYTALATATGHAPADPARFTVTPESSGAVPVEVVIPPGGHIRVEAHDTDDREIPVRVSVHGLSVPDPNLGPVYRAGGAGVIAVAPHGRTELPVPPGRYRVTVSHGPEWTLSQTEVTVTETLRGDVSARLDHVVPMEAWAGCDLHVHANPSYDSHVTIEDRVATLVAEGVTFATPTEHNVVGDYSAGVAVLPDGIAETLLWVPAVEVTTDRSAQPWGHFNVYPYRPDPATPGGSPPPFLNVSPRQIFRAARANNPDAIIQVNHPRMQPNIGYFNVTGLDSRTHRATSPDYDPGYDAIEVFNGFYLNQLPQVEAVLNDWMGLLASGARYIGTGSSDSHQVVYQWAGYPRTYVHVARDQAPGAEAVRDTATILRALRQGRAFVTSGPMLFLTAAEAEPGDVVPVTPQQPVRFRVRVQAAPWIPVDNVELYRDGQRVASLAVRPSQELTRLDAEVTLAMSPGSFVLAVARGPRGGLNAVLPGSEGTPFAFTNPIWFEGPTPRGR